MVFFLQKFIYEDGSKIDEHDITLKIEVLLESIAVLKTRKFAREVTESLVKILSDEGYNLIIERTFRTKEVPLRTEEILKKKGYETELSVIATKPEFSYLRSLKRYEEIQPTVTVSFT